MVEEEKKTNHKKTLKCVAYGIGSAATAAGGGALMILGGPLGLIAGGVILAAGLSGEVSTI